tara:strand:- start:965 stop:1738 length:774 start_codon:yes stop_codon:yes gene_type:complete
MDNTKIIKEINDNGFSIVENYFDKEELKFIKASFLETLQYINKSDETDLHKKYYEIKKFNPKLKGNWYDLTAQNLDLLKMIYKDGVSSLIKQYFGTKVVFSGRAAIHAHDDENSHLLLPHQETNQYSVNNLVFWSPIDDTDHSTGGLTVFENSHKEGYFEHKLFNSETGKTWTDKFTHIDKKITDRFNKVNLEVKAGSAVFMSSALIHSGYNNNKTGHVRITLTERFNPLQKIPYLRDDNAEMKIPYMGVNLNLISD